MWDIFRDSAFGQTIRFLPHRKLALYPEESSDFKLPREYIQESTETPINHSVSLNDPNTATNSTHSASDQETALEENPNERLESEESVILVTWYSPSDPENPQNWSVIRRTWVSLLILLYTFSVYISSSLHTASAPSVISIFHVNDVVASLGLSLYVLGYRIGPMLFSPLSEIPMALWSSKRE